MEGAAGERRGQQQRQEGHQQVVATLPITAETSVQLQGALLGTVHGHATSCCGSTSPGTAIMVVHNLLADG
jgi:hypothetical protein